jgi:tRNA nucleotidyltransferase/poly(A) polymerase
VVAKLHACSRCSIATARKRVVVGAVRNTLLRLPVAEIDVATTALLEQILEYLSDGRE